MNRTDDERRILLAIAAVLRKGVGEDHHKNILTDEVLVERLERGFAGRTELENLIAAWKPFLKALLVDQNVKLT